MEWLILGIGLLFAVFAIFFAPAPPVETMQPAGLEDFAVPENTTYKVVPKVYGTAYLKGNCIYYGNLSTTKIQSCSSGGK